MSPLKTVVGLILFIAGLATNQLDAQVFLNAKGDSLIRMQYRFFPGTEPRNIVARITEGKIFFQGDICLGKYSATTLRAATIPSGGALWSNGVMPYVIEPGHPYTTQIMNAINRINDSTQYVTLIPRTNEANYVRIISTENGCYSTDVGMAGGEQIVNLGNGCNRTYIAQHELMHALGFYHEHTRSDRDTYITINWENIIPGVEDQFQKYAIEYPGQDLGPYDYASLMHYGATAFSKNGLPTIEVNIPPGDADTRIGQAKNMSPLDIAAMDALYGPSDPCSKYFENWNLGTGTLTGTEYIATNQIISANTISGPGQIVFKTQGSVVLRPGFTATGPFFAIIDPSLCNGTVPASAWTTLAAPISLSQPIVDTEIAQVQIFPNPASREVHLRLDGFQDASEIQIRIFSPVGQLLQRQVVDWSSATASLDISNLNPGLYVVHILEGTKVLKTEKLMVY